MPYACRARSLFQLCVLLTVAALPRPECAGTEAWLKRYRCVSRNRTVPVAPDEQLSRQSWSQRQGRDPITHPGYECPVGRHSVCPRVLCPDTRESSAAAAECPALACATCSGLRLTVASAAAGCFRMAVLSRPDIVSWSVTKLGHWDVRSPEQIFGRRPPPLLLLLPLLLSPPPQCAVVSEGTRCLPAGPCSTWARTSAGSRGSLRRCRHHHGAITNHHYSLPCSLDHDACGWPS